MENVAIKCWAEDDRPREKLLCKGKKHLSDAELLAIIFGSGSKDCSAVELARQILGSTENDLSKIADYGKSDLCQFKGVGPAKAVTLMATFELGRRMLQMQNTKKHAIIKSSKSAYEQLVYELSDLKHEAFWILLLNRRNGVISKKQISQGGITGTVVDSRVIFKYAIEESACALILAHNHPSGNLKPSESDLSLTKKLVKGGKLIDIDVLDHLIITKSSYLSFADEGLI